MMPTKLETFLLIGCVRSSDMMPTKLQTFLFIGCVRSSDMSYSFADKSISKYSYTKHIYGNNIYSGNTIFVINTPSLTR